MKLKLGLIGLLALLIMGCSSTDPLAKDDGSLTYRIHNPTAIINSSSNNLWLLVGRDMHMNHYPEQPAVQTQIQWYMLHTDFLERSANRADPYVYYILQQIKQRQMPSEFVLLPFLESGYNPFAHSGAGAAGLWQMMPSTALGFSLRENWWYDGRRDFYTSTQAALDYLQYLHTLFHGDWLLALAAYNCGEGTVSSAIRYNQRHELPTDFWNLDLPEQTRIYVPSLFALAIIVANPHQYPVAWPPTKVAPAVASVPVGSQIDLDKAAQMAGISVNEIYYLNPGCTRWATDPNGDHTIIIPADKIDEFEANLAKLPPDERISWETYTVKPGDNLNKVANKLHVSTSLLQKVNELKNHILHAGRVLLVPKANQHGADPLNSATQPVNRTLCAPLPEIYIVRRSDSLQRIARTHHVDVRNLIFWNHLKAKQELKPGTRLIIHSQTPVNHYVANTANTNSEKVPPNRALLPVMNPASAQNNNQSNNLLLMANNKSIPKNNVTSIIPTTYKVKAGDTLIAIAHKFNLDPKVLKNHNALKDNRLRIGQILKIPTE